MRDLKVRIRIGVLVLLLAISGVVAYQNWSLTQEINRLQQKNEENIAELAHLNSEIQKKDEQIKTLPKLEAPMLLRLQSKEFKGDQKEIVSDLLKHSELIPYEGVLGGTMGFYDDKSIYVISDQWVLASFSDGHTGGYMLLKYDWNEGKFSWKVIDSYLL